MLLFWYKAACKRSHNWRATAQTCIIWCVLLKPRPLCSNVAMRMVVRDNLLEAESWCNELSKMTITFTLRNKRRDRFDPEKIIHRFVHLINFWRKVSSVMFKVVPQTTFYIANSPPGVCSLNCLPPIIPYSHWYSGLYLMLINACRLTSMMDA